jgi:hypothetical protein
MLSVLQAGAYTNKKVILLAPRVTNGDTLGYNFVNDLANAAYDWINKGQVVLWDSPEKKTTLGISDLKGIEKSSETAFNNLANVFIYETWTSTANKFSFVVKGFSFTGSNAKGEDVLFGYVECNQIVKDLLKATSVHVNANGNYGTTLYTALMNNGYQFSLIYYDNAPLQDYKNSARIVHKSIDKKKNANAIIMPESKLVVYGWDSSILAQTLVSDDLTTVLSDFFNQNKQEFFNYGGDKYYSYLRNSNVLISGFRVTQRWTRENNGKITYTLLSITPYTVGIPLQPIPAAKLDEWKLTYKDIPLSEYLTSKDFTYSIKKINENTIPPQIAENFKNALFAGNWHTILSVYLKGE